jgi:hypothetical protein
MINRMKLFVLWIMFWVLQLIRGKPDNVINMQQPIRVKKNLDPYGKRYFNKCKQKGALHEKV